MNSFARMVVCLIICVILLGCESNKEEDVQVTLSYNHTPRQSEYPEANFKEYYKRPLLKPVLQRHQINVKDFLEKNIYDKTELDENLKGTVEVPVDIKLEVEYENYTLEQPQIYYESGTSDPFIVTHNSSPTTTVTVPVSVNPNHPSQVVEEEIVEETITTHTFSWSDNFTYNVSPTQTQKQTYIDFWDNASHYSWDNISIGNSDNITVCDNKTILSDIAANIDNTTYEFQGRYCNGLYWTIGRCGWGNEISAFPASVKDCQCRTDGYVVRPLISNKNWGGVGKSCGAPSQTLQVILKR